MFEWLFGRSVYRWEISVIDGDSINWRKGGWGDDGQQTDGAVPYRLGGFDAPAIGGRAKTKVEAEWGDAATTFLKDRIEKAGAMKLKDRGPDRHERRRVANLYIDGVDVAEMMIRARMAVEDQWDDTGHLIRPDWDELWKELRPLG